MEAHPQKGSIVAAITPIVALVASWLSGVLAEHVPGVQLDTGQITAVMIATVTSVVGIALKWLHGWQRYEEQQARPPIAVSRTVSAKRQVPKKSTAKRAA